MDEQEQRVKDYRRKEALRDNTNALRWANLTPIAGADLSEYYKPLAIIHFPLYNGISDTVTDIVFSNSGRGYWIVNCFIPIELANKIFNDQVGKDLIRVGGHCGCLPPESQCGWYTNDFSPREIVTNDVEEQEKQMDYFIAKGLIKQAQKDKLIFNSNPQSIGAKQYVTLYHIDGDLGLRVFTDWISVYKDMQKL